MGSGYYGQPNLGNEQRSSSSGSSSRKSGKKGSSEKPKQPQRGLGVAQLEKIRLHSQMGCTSYNLPSSAHNPYATQEDVRMQTAYSSSSSFSYSTPSSSSYGFPAAPHQNYAMGYGEYEGITNIRYGDSQPTPATRWAGGNTYIDYTQQYAQPAGMTRQLLDLQAQEAYENRKKKHGSDSSSQNSESSSGNAQDLDLELRLSL